MMNDFVLFENKLDWVYIEKINIYLVLFLDIGNYIFEIFLLVSENNMWEFEGYKIRKLDGNRIWIIIYFKLGFVIK